MAKKSYENQLAIDAIDILFHLTLRTMNSFTHDCFNIYIEIKRSVEKNLLPSDGEDEAFLITHYSLCLIQIFLMQERYCKLSSLMESHWVFKEVDIPDCFDEVEDFSYKFTAGSSLAVIEMAMERLKVDYARVNEIASSVFSEKKSKLDSFDSSVFTDLSIKSFLASNPYWVLGLVSYLKHEGLINYGKIRDAGSPSLNPLVALALHAEFNSAISSGLYELYKNRLVIKEEKENPVMPGNGKIVSEVVSFNKDDLSCPIRKDVILATVNGLRKSYAEAFPISKLPSSKSESLILMKYISKSFDYRIFSTKIKTKRTDRVISIVSGYYVYWESIFHCLASDSGVTGRYGANNENGFSSMPFSESTERDIKNRFGIRLSDKTLYREFLEFNKKDSIFLDAFMSWEKVVKRLDLEYGELPFLRQAISGRLGYMV